MAYDAHITVVRGRPDAAELAAVTVVLCSLLNRLRPRAEPGTDGRAAPLARATWGRERYRPPVAWSADPYHVRGTS